MNYTCASPVRATTLSKSKPAAVILSRSFSRALMNNAEGTVIDALSSCK